MKSITTLSLLLSLFLLSSCNQDNKRNIKAFYYPIEELKNGLVYQYEAVGNDSIAPYYKYYISIENDTGVFLASNYYDHTFTNTQFSLEQIIPEGVLLKEYHFMSYDSLGDLSKKVVSTIQSGSLMLFSLEGENQYFNSEIAFQDFNDSLLTINLRRSRKYLQDTSYHIMGKERACLAFSVKESISYNNQGEYLEYQSDILELYAEQLGLVYFKKVIQNRLSEEFKLVRQFPMDTLTQKAKPYLSID